MELTGWGRHPRVSARACRPERRRDAVAALTRAEAASGMIAHGGGRSYGDQALNGGGDVMLTGRLDRVLAFDPATGEIVVESGVTFADLMRDFLPRGFMVPVTPGTAFATIGGAVANDVHGKNHDRAGSFGDYVRWIDLLLPSGEVRRVSPENDDTLFAATIGGAGLTGIILAIAFPLVRTQSPHVSVTRQRMPDLAAFLAAFAETRETASYSVGWIDALATGGSLGRGILETAETAPASGALSPRRARRIGFDFPALALNNLTVRAFNEIYYRRIPAGGATRTEALPVFFYPLDALLEWNRIYGKPGFAQFQCALPEAAAENGLTRLLEAISRSGAASFLAVLKTLGGKGRGMLSFPVRGHTLALDFPWRRGTPDLLRQLEAITLEHGGRIYLAKDCALSAEGFRLMYPRREEFMAVRARIDPAGRLQSDMARRLGLVGENGK